MLRQLMLVMVCLICGFQLSANIIETNEMSTVENHITNDTLVLFNITGTLYEPSTTLSDNQWRTYFSERVNAIVQNKSCADRLINNVKNAIVNNLPKKPVEEFTPPFIANLQDQKIVVLGISQKQVSTSYADNFGLITRNHLLNVGINLENTLGYLHMNGQDNQDHSFTYGIIFTNKKPVGPAITAFLNRLENKPSKIIMVDNSLKSLNNAEESLMTTGIPFQGFRYGRSDILKQNFDPTIGTIQFFYFIAQEQIISDERALQVKESNPDVDYNALLDTWIIESVSWNCNEVK